MVYIRDTGAGPYNYTEGIFCKRNVLQELNASLAEIVIRLEEQPANHEINEAAALHRPHNHWRSYLPRLLTYHIPLRWLPGEPHWTSDTPTTSPLGLHITASTGTEVSQSSLEATTRRCTGRS
ncbi:hypothetical protein J6590_078931 [Homalodisca vitripennis]|nr:hypothetical protein J6590_078931 [Homalodisca vitripennis]